MLIQDHTFNAKRFSPLIYDEKVVNHYKNLKPGTLAYDDFWDEQDEYCLYGYKPKGMHAITGEHWSYLNIAKIEMLPQGQLRKRAGNPYYRDLDNRLFWETWEAKKYHYGLIVGKPRRVGLSWFGAWQMVYEMLFNKENRVGICAGKQDKADAFYAKVIYMLDKLIPEYQVARLYKNDKILKLGYTDIINKQTIDRGLCSEMLIRTMFADSAGFEGESMSVTIFEEAGLFANLIQSYKSTEPCFREGAIQFGTPLIYGTGGNIEKGAQGYMEMWKEHKAYNLRKVFIPADEYYPGDGEIDEETGIKGPSFFDIETGKTNRAAARKHILKERERAKKSKEAYTKHVQNYPLEEREIFIKSSGGLLDRVLLNHQLMNIEDGVIPPNIDIQRGRFEWVDDEMTKRLVSGCKDLKQACKIRVKRGSKVKFVLDENGTIEKIFDRINNDQHKPDIAGCDSYDEETENPNASYGATVVYRTYAGPSKEYNLPIALLHERGDATSDDTFFENNVKMAIYYDYELLVEYSKIAVINYFQDVGAEKYLKERPDLRKELGPTTSKNKYGQRMTADVKNLVTKLLKKEVKENCGNIWFLKMIMDLIDYGDKNTDIAMAFGQVMLYKLDIFEDMLQDYDEMMYEEDHVLDSMTYYDYDYKGNLIIRPYGEDTEVLQIFDPNNDLDEFERAEIKAQRKKEMIEFEERKKIHEERRKNSMQDLIMSEILKTQNLS